MSIIYTPPPATGGAAPTVLCQTITLAALQALQASSGLICGRLYTITNPFANPLGYGTVTVQATSNNTLAPAATWNRPGNNKSGAGIIFSNTMAAGNSIDQLIVNGINLLSTAVFFNTSLAQTMIDLTVEINSNTGTSNFKAYNTASGVVLRSTLPGQTLNGLSTTVNVSGFIGATYNGLFNNGEDTGIIEQYDCLYSVNAAMMFRVSSLSKDFTVSCSTNDNGIFNFPFNYGDYSGSYFDEPNILRDTIYCNGAFSIGVTYSYSLQFYNVLYDSIAIFYNNIKNYNFNTTDGLNITVLNSYFSTFNGINNIFQGSFDIVYFNNVVTDGIYYRCSDTIQFTGAAGGGAVGTDIFMQTSPNNFCYNGNTFVKIYGDSITFNLTAELSIGTSITPTGLCQQLGTGFYNGVPTIGAALPFIAAQPFNKFTIRPYVDDTTGGTLTYVIEGFLAP